MKKKVLITGASGLLGSNLLLDWKNIYEIRGLYSSHALRCEWAQTRLLNLLDTNAVIDEIRSYKPNLVVHCAALTDIDRCEREPDLAYALNVTATRVLAEETALIGAKFIALSTDAFFSGIGGPFKETDSPSPVNYYGETKLLAEREIENVSGDHLILRTNIFGWNAQRKLSFSEWICNTLMEKKKISLVKDVWFSPILTNSLGDIMRLLIDRNSYGCFHIAGSEALSKLDFGYAICDLYDFDRSLIQEKSIQEIGLLANRSNNMALSIEKASLILGKNIFPSVKQDLLKKKYLFETGYVNQLKSLISISTK